MKSAFSQNPILIIDRLGLIGEPLSQKLAKEFQVVFVSHIPSANIRFFGKIPAIPDSQYSHIIFIDEDGQDLELLGKIIEKVKNVNADFIFAQRLSITGKYAIGKVLRLYPNTKTVLFGDIFDDKLILKQENFTSTVNKYIYQAQKFGRMQVLGEGMRETYPVFLQDVVDGFIDLVFGVNKKHSLFYLFPKHPVSELSLAHMIQKMNPEITIDFIRHDSRLGNISFPADGLNLLGDKYALAKKIRSIDIKKNPFRQLADSGKIQNKSLPEKTKKAKKLIFFIIWILIILLFCPFIFTSFFSVAGTNTLYYAKGEMDRGNFAKAKSALDLSRVFFRLGKQTSNLLFFQPKNLSQNLDSGLNVSESLLQIFSSGNYFSAIVSGKSKNPVADFAKGVNYLKSSIVVLDRIKAEGKIPTPILQNLEIVNPLIKLLSATADILPSILGMEEPKTYLILLQDNTELRPGGGKINSYGILKFSLGKITEFSMHDVSDADSQLRGHVEPPFALRRYLPSEHWHMRDSNFDVDFVKSALSASKLLLAETGQEISGVIGVDASLMAKITKGKMSYLLIAQEISRVLIQKQLLFEFKDVQSIFTVNGWSSSLWDGRVNAQGRINDFVGINEANLGRNKINNFIKRQIAQNVKIEQDGSLFGELNISYKNDAGSFLPDGNYKNYLRIILPLNTLLSSISINDVSETIVDAVIDPQVYKAKNFKIPKGIEVEKEIEDEKTIYGFLVNVARGEQVKIKIQYTVPRKIAFDLNNFSYSLKIFKQPGVDTLPYSLQLYYPENLNVVSAGALKKEDNVLSYSENIMGDKNLIINFAKK